MYSLSTSYSNILVKGWHYDIFVQVFFFNFVSAAGTFPFFLLQYNDFNFSTFEIISIAFLGLFSYSIGAILYFYSLRALKPLTTVSATYIIPLLTMLFSSIIFSMPVRPYFVISFLLLLAGLVLVNISPASPVLKFGDMQVFDITEKCIREGKYMEMLRGGKRAFLINDPEGAVVTKNVQQVDKNKYVVICNLEELERILDKMKHNH